LYSTYVALTTLNLSRYFYPQQEILEGIPFLKELNLHGNKIAELRIPDPTKLLLRNLKTLDLGFNNLIMLPDNLDQLLPALRTLRIPNNMIFRIGPRICSSLKQLDASSNPVTEPPIETCERGVSSMCRYWQCIREEEEEKRRKKNAEYR